jgi:hypothetical protein
MASWYATDIIREQYPQFLQQSGGYVSYTEGERVKCVFFGKKQPLQTIAIVSFDTSFEIDKAIVDTVPRPASMQEQTLLKLRRQAIEKVNADENFKRYKNTNYNFIPLSDEKGNRVYSLTAPTVHGVVILGNDYLFSYNKAGKLKGFTPLHKGIITLKHGKTKGGVSMHTHVIKPLPLITVTDICTLRLYARFTGWESHIVMSKKKVSIYNIKENTLTVISKKAWDRMQAHQAGKSN